MGYILMHFLNFRAATHPLSLFTDRFLYINHRFVHPLLRQSNHLQSKTFNEEQYVILVRHFAWLNELLGRSYDNVYSVRLHGTGKKGY